MADLAAMAAKGESKLRRKATAMAASYAASKGRAVENFQAVGFGPTRTANYRAGVEAADYRAPDPSKWSRNWQAKMRE
jgi:hypothetical protein